MSIEVAGVFRDTLLGLKVIYNNGWVYRDLKPPNIGVILGRVVLLDVG
jgi:serine/threonine protein kinase